MKRISVVVFMSLAGATIANAQPAPKPVCRAYGYNSQSCDKLHGFLPPNGTYLEGIGMETLHFVASNGRLTEFPPAGGTVLKAQRTCGTAPEIPDAKVVSCRSKGKTAATCVVHFETVPSICITHEGQVDKEDQTLIAVPGYWDGTGAYQEDASTVTLACAVPDPTGPPGSVNSAVGTCVGGGYSLDTSRSKSRDSRAKFLACVRAVRADYCGDGTPHTRAYTPIAIHDSKVNPMKQKWCANGKDPDGFDYEATWSPDGAVCFFHDRWTGKGMSDDACNAKMKSQPCRPNDRHAIVSTRSSCNVCPSYTGSAPVCTPDHDPVCPNSPPAKTP